MFVNRSEWKMIEVFSVLKSIEPKNLSTSFDCWHEIELKKTLDSLIENNIVFEFYCASVEREFSSYNLNPIGYQIAKRGFLKHNVIYGVALLNKHKEWVTIIIGIIGLIVVLSKC